MALMKDHNIEERLYTKLSEVNSMFTNKAWDNHEVDYNTKDHLYTKLSEVNSVPTGRPA